MGQKTQLLSLHLTCIAILLFLVHLPLATPADNAAVAATEAPTKTSGNEEVETSVVVEKKTTTVTKTETTEEQSSSGGKTVQGKETDKGEETTETGDDGEETTENGEETTTENGEETTTEKGGEKTKTVVVTETEFKESGASGKGDSTGAKSAKKSSSVRKSRRKWSRSGGRRRGGRGRGRKGLRRITTTRDRNWGRWASDDSEEISEWRRRRDEGYGPRYWTNEYYNNDDYYDYHWGDEDY